MYKRKIDIFDALSRIDSLTPEEKAAVNNQMKHNHQKKILHDILKAVLNWLKRNWLALAALIVSVVALFLNGS